jgi:hypothetical protein
MFEHNSNGWTCYPLEISRHIEIANRDAEPKVSFQYESAVHTIDFDGKVVTTSDGLMHRLRQHLLGDGFAAMWELLKIRYDKPLSLHGKNMITVLNKLWNGRESINGNDTGLSFIFLYAMLCGEIKCKLLGSHDDYGKWGLQANANKRNFEGAFESNRDNSNDSIRFAILLSQFYSDIHMKSLPASLINILCRNKQVCGLAHVHIDIHIYGFVFILHPNHHHHNYVPYLYY